MPPMMLRAMLHSTKNRMTHQNSRREARPENTAYFVKKRLTALPKVATVVGLIPAGTMPIDWSPGMYPGTP